MGETQTRTATLAGGCFWCIETAFVEFPGVVKVESGYVNGYVEGVQITYDPDKVRYEQLLDQFWIQIDPTDPGGQFADRGPEYETGIYWHDEEQRQIAEDSRRRLQESKKFDKPIVTHVKEFKKFDRAEEYHQEFAKKNPLRYYMYKEGSGRARFIKEHSGKR